MLGQEWFIQGSRLFYNGVRMELLQGKDGITTESEWSYYRVKELLQGQGGFITKARRGCYRFEKCSLLYPAVAIYRVNVECLWRQNGIIIMSRCQNRVKMADKDAPFTKLQEKM